MLCSTMGCSAICTLTNRAFPFISSSLYRGGEVIPEQTERRSLHRSAGQPQRSAGHFSAQGYVEKRGWLGNKGSHLLQGARGGCSWWRGHFQQLLRTMVDHRFSVLLCLSHRVTTLSRISQFHNRIFISKLR